MEGKDTTLSPTWDEARWASRRNLSAWLMGLLVGAILVFAFGCSTPYQNDLGPAGGDAAYGRSVSFMPADQGFGPSAFSADAWYATRNDRGLEVFAGYDYPEESVVTTRSATRLYVYDGRVRDHSRTWTTTESVRLRVR